MKNIFFFFLIFNLLLIISCQRKVVIPCTKDVFLSSDMPNRNINGKNEPEKGKGFGVVKSSSYGHITYPAMYLGSGSEYSVKDAFVLGGFDLSPIKGKVVHASLKFFINFSSSTRKNVCVFVRPLNRKWDENEITYLDVYDSAKQNAKFKSIVDINDADSVLIVFDIKRSGDYDFRKIPLKDAYRTVSIDITKIVAAWMDNSRENHGVLIDPMWFNDPRYPTTNNFNELADFGVIEVAAREWMTWDGLVPQDFYLDSGNWINIKNNAYNKLKYIPRLEIVYE